MVCGIGSFLLQYLRTTRRKGGTIKKGDRQMKAPFSPHLLLIRDGLKELVALLGKDYEYVSLLATDSKGLSVSSSRHRKSVDNRTMGTERGIVLRVWQDGGYAEYAFNEFYPDMVETVARKAKQELEAQLAMLQAVLPHVSPAQAEAVRRVIMEREYELLELQGKVEEQLRPPYDEIYRVQSASYKCKHWIKRSCPGLHRLYRKRQGYGE